MPRQYGIGERSGEVEVGRRSDVLGEIVSEREGGTGRESENGHGERKKWDG